MSDKNKEGSGKWAAEKMSEGRILCVKDSINGIIFKTAKDTERVKGRVLWARPFGKTSPEEMRRFLLGREVFNKTGRNRGRRFTDEGSRPCVDLARNCDEGFMISWRDSGFFLDHFSCEWEIIL